VITDMRLPDGLGLELCSGSSRSQRARTLIVMTAYGSAENAVEALKAGAFDYLTKPVDLKQFRAVVASAVGAPPRRPAPLARRRRPKGAPAMQPRSRAPPPSRRQCRRAGPRPPGCQALVGIPAMRLVKSRIDKVARSMAPVLVRGESGTGKELVARAIHEVSPRGTQPFIAVNCSAIPEHLLEAEFFGYRKGAFTGAAEDREGFFQAAARRHAVPRRDRRPAAGHAEQAAARHPGALGAAGGRGQRRVGQRAHPQRHAQGPGAEVQAGRFRQDLFYRLNVIQIACRRCANASKTCPRSAKRVLERIARDAGVSPAPR
jgi:two-component system response regulator PilR (NtrC family)